jgi:DNA-binding NarL/FixJ family response regulator
VAILRLDHIIVDPFKRDEEFVAYQTRSAREKVFALLIDDDAVDAEIFAILAARSKQLDVELKICRSVEEGARLTSERRFDLIYVDYWLGLQTSIAFISEFTKRQEAPCILLTGLDEPDIRRIAFRAGVRAFLSKEDLSTQAIEAVTLAVLNGRIGN